MHRDRRRKAVVAVAQFIAQLLFAAIVLHPAFGSARRRAVRSGSPAAGDLFVASNGCDSCGWSGTLAAPNASNTDGPFATIPRAQQAVQALKATRTSGAITVMVRGGTYFLQQPLVFGVADSGTSSLNVIWQTYPGETPVINGGVRVTGWTNVSANLWQAALPPSTVQFESLFYNGQRRMRPRIGASSGNTLGAFLRVASEVFSPTSTSNCSVFISGSGYKCLDRFHYNPNDPIAETWSNLVPPTGNPCGSSPGQNQSLVGDIEIDLFEAWTMEQMRVSCIDTANKAIYFTASTGGLNSLPDFRGPTAGHRYVVENVKDLLQQPGQWFLDRSTSPWLLNYLADDGENPNSDVVIAPQVQPILSAIQLASVTFQGLTFEMDNFVPGPSGFNQDENGENYLPGALDCESCQKVVFDGVTVRHTSASGVQIASMSDNSGVPAANDVAQNSTFYDIGDCGIHIGHHPNGSDKPANMVQFVTIQNNLIDGYSRVFADGEGIAQGNGHDITYTHNDITDGYHAGISVCNLGCPSGDFNIVSSYNHIWNIMQGITADGGTLYYNTGSASKSGSGNKILHNLVHDVTDSSIIDQGVRGSGYGGEGIYLDAQTAGALVEGNVVYRVSAETMFQTEGPGPGQPPNTVNNNIFAYARQGMFQEQEPWPQGCTSPSLRISLTNNIFYFDRDDKVGFYAIQGCPYSCALPYNQFQLFQGNLYWRKDGLFASYPRQFHVVTTPPANCNGSVSSTWTFLTLPQWQDTPTVGGSQQVLLEDSGSVIANPMFGNPAYPFDDFSLAVAPVAGFQPGLTNDTLMNAGRIGARISPPNVPATFPTFHYDPTTDF